jgi:hypothetical protein
MAWYNTALQVIGLAPKTPPEGPPMSVATAAGAVVQGATAYLPLEETARPVAQSSGTNWTPWLIGGAVVAYLLLRRKS